MEGRAAAVAACTQDAEFLNYCGVFAQMCVFARARACVCVCVCVCARLRS